MIGRKNCQKPCCSGTRNRCPRTTAQERPGPKPTPAQGIALEAIRDAELSAPGMGLARSCAMTLSGVSPVETIDRMVKIGWISQSTNGGRTALHILPLGQKAYAWYLSQA